MEGEIGIFGVHCHNKSIKIIEALPNNEYYKSPLDGISLALCYLFLSFVSAGTICK
jgi:hypothetical protein